MTNRPTFATISLPLVRTVRAGDPNSWNAGPAWKSALSFKNRPRTTKGSGRAVHLPPRPPTVSMVDYNLINSLGNLDADVDAAVATALGTPTPDLDALVKGDDAQDLTPGNIIKGKVSSKAGDDFIVELGL